MTEGIRQAVYYVLKTFWDETPASDPDLGLAPLNQGPCGCQGPQASFFSPNIFFESTMTSIAHRLHNEWQK
jgi:hypothetical protein